MLVTAKRLEIDIDQILRETEHHPNILQAIQSGRHHKCRARRMSLAR